MARVLHLAHHYPPIGGVVGRNLDLSRYLPEFGHEPTVLTGPEADAGAWGWAPRDEALAARVGEVEVLRVPGPVPPNATGMRAKVERVLERPTPRVRWWVDGAVRTACQLHGRFDVILANLLPLETAFAATQLSRMLGIPWVADLDDPWALDEMRVAPTVLNDRVDRARMRRGLAGAAAIVMSCPEAAARLRRELPELANRPVEAIAHGFNANDFQGARRPRDDSAFRVVHTGSLHTRLGLEHRASRAWRRRLGGTSVDVDIHTRSHVYFLQALEKVRAAGADDGRPIELHLVGHVSDTDRAVVEGVEGVHVHGQLPHPDTIGMARSADLLFLPMHDLPVGQRAGIVPCKTYEYLAAERPILAAVPDGDCRELLGRFERASLTRPGDVEAIAAGLRDRLLHPERGVGIDGVGSPALAPYERREMSRRIAAVLDVVTGVRGTQRLAA